MTVSEAMQRGLTRLCKARWEFKDDRLELQTFSGEDGKKYYGPWATLVSPQSAKVFNDETYHRQVVMILGDTTDDWVEWVESPA